MSKRFTCPRRIADGRNTLGGPFRDDGPDKDRWIKDHGHRVCSYDGSLHADEFMDYVRAGGGVGPTDKGYKFYLDEIEVRGAGKFYTHHLSAEQSEELLRMWLRRTVNWGYPGAPYTAVYLPGVDLERREAIIEEEIG